MHEREITAELLLVNLIICISKWVIWKTRNDIKYNKSIYSEIIVTTNELHICSSYYTVYNERNYNYNYIHNVSNNNRNFIISYNFRTSEFLIIKADTGI
jgi:hypothetical protein